jgi:hypothetical protein
MNVLNFDFFSNNNWEEIKFIKEHLCIDMIVFIYLPWRGLELISGDKARVYLKCIVTDLDDQVSYIKI